MGKRIRLYLTEDDYERLQKLAKASNKSLNQFARELLIGAVKQELKDTGLLNRLIQRIENLSMDSQQQNLILPLLYELKNLLFVVYVVVRNTLLNSSIPEATKHSLIQLFNQIETERFGVSLYELFGLKK